MFDLKFLQNYDPGNASNVVSSESWQKYIQFRKVSKIKLARAKTKLISNC